MSIYGKQIAAAQAAAIDTGKLAEAWAALHPSAVTKAASPVLAAFLSGARAALTRALTAVLGRLWPEAWTLGQQAARAVTAAQVAGAEVAAVDWAGWTPGDYLAAQQVAGEGLARLLAASGITIQSIADSRVGELAAVLKATLASDVIHVPPLPEPLPPTLSAGSLARQLKDVLDNPERAELVAHTEIARAQAAAARVSYAEHGVAETEVLTAEDDRVCPVCDAAEAAGPQPLGWKPGVPLHPRCRCAEMPVVAGAA